MLRTTVVHRSREVRQSANAVPHLSENASTVLARVHNTAVYEPGPATRSAYAEQVLKVAVTTFERRVLYGALCCADRWARFFYNRIFLSVPRKVSLALLFDYFLGVDRPWIMAQKIHRLYYAKQNMTIRRLEWWTCGFCHNREHRRYESHAATTHPPLRLDRDHRCYHLPGRDQGDGSHWWESLWTIGWFCWGNTWIVLETWYYTTYTKYNNRNHAGTEFGVRLL